jgi:hypothetical protein
MRITRRRKRRPDQFASPDWVRFILDQLKESFPLLSSLEEKDLVKLARAIRHVERYPATDTRRGRPSRWPREDLVKLDSKLGEILARETQDRISVATFVDHYLRSLDFPSDLLERLSKGDVNLFEAEQLARVSARRLRSTQSEARRKRSEILSSHMASRSSGERLRRRINELLGVGTCGGSLSTLTGQVVESTEELEDFDPYDPSHLFWEEIKQLGFAFRDIRREDLDDELLEELLKASEPVWRVLNKIKTLKNKKAVERLAL